MPATPLLRTLLLLTPLCALSLCAEERSAANHHLRLLGEFVYMRRSEIHNHTVIKDSAKPQNPCNCLNFDVINNKHLVNDLGFEPGFRTALIYTENLQRSYELNLLYLTPWETEKKAHGNQSLSYPFSNSNYTTDFHNASAADVTYSMHFWDLELNYWRHFTPRYTDYFSLSGIAGLRYFHWNEGFTVEMHRPPDKSDYHIHTRNHLFGLQLGLNFQMTPTPWLEWELAGKIGPMVNRAEQKTFLGDQNNTVTLRRFDQQKWEWGWFADIAALIGFQFKEHLNLHAGYEILFFTGLALAPEQVSKQTTPNAGRHVYVHGAAIIHGLFAGMTWSF